MIDRDDPVLAQLPYDDDVPRSFLYLPHAEKLWRGRFFAVSWILNRNEAYSWALALAADPDGESEEAISGASDGQILGDRALCPMPK